MRKGKHIHQEKRKNYKERGRWENHIEKKGKIRIILKNLRKMESITHQISSNGHGGTSHNQRNTTNEGQIHYSKMENSTARIVFQNKEICKNTK